MAVIRIIDLPETSKSLIDELRARGFTVYTGAEAQPDSAELQLSVEECSIEEALEKCSQPSGEPVAVFMAPGAVDDSWRPIAMVPLLPQVDQGRAAHQDTVLTPANGDCEQYAASMMTSKDSEAPSVEVSGGLQEASAELSVIESSAQQGQPQETAVYASVEEVLEPAALTASESALNVEARLSDETVAPGPIPAVPIEQSAELINAEPMTVESVSSSQSVAALNDVAEAEQPKANEMQADDDVGAAQASDWPIWNPLSEPVFAVEDAGDEQEMNVAGVASAKSRSMVAAWSSLKLDERLFWKAAPVAAALALFILFAMTMVHRVSPLPPSISQSEEQNQQPPLSHAGNQHDAHLQKVSADSAMVGETLDGRHPTSRPHSSVVPAGVSMASKRQRINAGNSTSARNDDGFVARDTIVRYPGKTAVQGTARKPAENGKRSDIRRYSDLPTAAR